MRTVDDVVEIIRSADPLDRAESRAWMATHSARHVSDAMRSQQPMQPVRRTRSTKRLIAVAVATTIGLSGVAAAAAVLGREAPDRVKQHLADLDAGMPADLRLNPDVERARSVAATPSGALYLADLADGGYCLEVVSDGDRPRGAACVRGADLTTRALEVTAPIPATDDAPILIGGRVDSDRIASVTVRYGSTTAVPVPLGLDHAWLLEVPDDKRDAALDHGVLIAGLDRGGVTVATERVPALRDDDPQGTAHDQAQPLFVSTISDQADLTRVLGVEGRVNATGATHLELRFPDGSTSAVDLAADGTYKVLLPAGRQDDFGTVAGSLVALDARGRVIATSPVASVAYWRSRNP